MIAAYTPPAYNEIDLELPGDYTAPSFNDINLILGEEDAQSNWCYQEFANESTSCGGLSTGTYRDDGVWELPDYGFNNTIDGDWTTYGFSPTTNDGYIYINYSKPVNATNASLWEVKDFTARFNLSIAIDCFTQSTLQFQVISEYTPSGYVHWNCYNGTGWQTLNQSKVTIIPYVYEEAMWWYMGENATPSTDSCTCSAINTNHVIQMHDFCNITNCNLGTGNLTFNSTGYATCVGSINVSNMGDPGTNAILYINSTCNSLIG